MFTNMLTMGRVLPCTQSQPCMPMDTCAKGRNGALSHRAILDEMVDECKYFLIWDLEKQTCSKAPMNLRLFT